MLTPIHILFNLTAYFSLSRMFSFEMQLGIILLLLTAELIDLDHLFSRPIIKLNRNSFETHFFHRNWKMVILFAVILLFFNPAYAIGLGLISHLLLDWIDTQL